VETIGTSGGIEWGNMGTGTLFGHRDKAAASCRTPNASRLLTPTASAAALTAMGFSAHRAKSRPGQVRVAHLGGRVSCGWDLLWQRRVQWGLDQSGSRGDGVAEGISESGVSEGPGGAGAGAVIVRQLWFRPRRAYKHCGLVGSVVRERLQ